MPVPRFHTDELLTTAETCRYLKIAPRTLYRYIQERRMPAFKLGKEWRFVRSDLEQWLRAQAKATRR
jgi:excisionase family DNA binding protein